MYSLDEWSSGSDDGTFFLVFLCGIKSIDGRFIRDVVLTKDASGPKPGGVSVASAQEKVLGRAASSLYKYTT
jgi:hypothetical protein